MDWLIDLFVRLITSTPEYREWGWNIVAGSFLITVALTFGLQLPGVINQARKIWGNRSAEGIEMLTFISFFTYFAVFLVYAFSIHSGAGMINTFVLLPPQLFILAGVARFKKVRLVDMLAAIGGITLFALIITLPNKEIFFTIASVAVFIGLILQPIEMIRTKTSENVALSFPLGFSFVTFVWTIYAIAIGEWFLVGASGAFMLVYIWTTIMWFKYHSQRHNLA